MKNYAIFALFVFLTACTNGSEKMLDEKSASYEDVQSYSQDNSAVTPVQTNSGDSKTSENEKQTQSTDEATETTSNSNTNNQQTMTNSRTNVAEGIQLKDLAAEYTMAIIKTNMGDIKVKFYGEDSPLTVNNFMNLAQDGFYNGTRFHRIINDFMIQGGDPNSKDAALKDMWGTGGPDYRFVDEFNKHPLVKGSLAMANAGPSTNGSQFFIVTKDSTPWLDGKHTNFGEVIEGMDVVEKIEASQTDPMDRPLTDVVVESVELVK